MGTNRESNINRRINVEITTKICRFISSRRERRDCISIQKGLHLSSVKAPASFPQNLMGRMLVWTSPLRKKKKSNENCSKGSPD